MSDFLHQFISLSGVAVNVRQIDFVDFRQEGTVTIHVGPNAVTTSDPTEIEDLKESFQNDPDDDDVEDETAAETAQAENEDPPTVE